MGVSALQPSGAYPPILAGPPATPIEGQQYYDTTLHAMCYWNGTLWVPGIAADPAWITIASSVGFQNGWLQTGGAVPGYRKVGQRVYLRGTVSGGAANSVIMTMPVGYRPTQNVVSVGYVSGGTVTSVSVFPTGIVTCGTTQTWFDMVAFDII